MGSKTQTNTSQQTTTPINQAALQNIYNTVANAASTPYTPYTGELTAGINGQQTAGINTINNAANAGKGYYNSASGLLQSGSTPLTSQQIQNYQNPYTQQVVNATQAQFNDQNAQQQNSLKGNAAMQGALGGDRQAVAQAQLAGQQQLSQAPVIANLYSSGYNQAVQTAEQQQQNQLAAANSYGSLGNSAINAQLNAGQAQLGAGTLQQQTQQAADTANYGQYQAAQGFPYQQAAFLEQYGLPSALAQGTTSNGTQTGQGPNMLTQLLGLGTAGLVAYSDEKVKDNKEKIGETYDGQPIYRFNYKGSPMTQIGLMAQEVEGRHPDAVGESGGIKTVDYAKATDDAAAKGKFASGGTIGYINADVGYIPKGQASQSTLQSPSLQYMKQQDQSATDNAAGKLIGTGAKSLFSGSPSYGGGNMFTDEYGGSSSNPLPGLDASDYGEGFKIGGFVDAIHQIHRAVKRATGGEVGSTPFAAYDDGGDVPTFADRFQPAVDSPFTGPPVVAADDTEEPFRLSGPEAMNEWRKSVDHPNAAVAADAAMPGPDPDQPSAAPVALPKQITNPDSVPTPPSTALAYSGASPMAAASAPSAPAPQAAPAQAEESRWGGFNPFGLSDKAREAIIAGALGVAASRSPFALSAIGEGGLKGLQAYSQATQQEQEAAEKAATRAQEQQRIDLQAKQIAQSAEQFSKNYGLRKEELEQGYQPKFGVIAEDPETGSKIYGFADPNTKKTYDANGKEIDLSKLGPKITPTNPDGTPLTGEDYLKSLSPTRAALARGIAEYKVNPNSLSIRGGHREQAISDASRFDPTYDGAQFGARSKAVRDFATGTQGNTIRSLDVAIDHLDTLQKAGEALKNGDVKGINSLRNYWREQTGSELPGNFDAIKTIVGSEIAKAIVGGQNALHDRLAAQEGATNAKSPEQLAGVIRSYKQLMAGQLHGLQQQYESTTGLKNFNTRLRPGTIAELERAQAAQNGPPQSSGPQAGLVKDGYRFKGGDPSKKENWEKI